ncbi:dnaJ homolog subfamily B member 12 isoform X2 [Cylas formicarius]|uniref:dnaJ homolog subfamily B member 12 isoform X2 n=1 Tax=Cylas formicarius TaxID=197179 RepID=UPI0029583652|nr:dnaJ homolog subfamily B member 12 isoform X2 [Cylas formicarius]
MDSNKDEALRCIEMAEKYIKERNKEKAQKFLEKAERLYPTQKAKDLLLHVEILASRVETEQPRKRNMQPKTEETTKKPEYTTEQVEGVKRIRSCKDYYEILQISKDATDSEIKKSYRRIALQMHPDKNKAPGADEAFKAVGNAVAVLTDPEKRKQYDLYGNEEDRPQRSHNYNTYSRGFEADVNAEELFNMFFGSGFTGSNVYVRRGGRWQRQTTGSQQEHRHREQNSFSAFIQLLPIIIAILLSMASSFFISDPAYSLQANSKYPIMRRTQNMQIPYYVKENFHSEYQGSVKRLEMSVEEDYVTGLRHQCYREKTYRDSMIWKARNFGDRDLYQNAQNLKMPSCDKLQDLQRTHG